MFRRRKYDVSRSLLRWSSGSRRKRFANGGEGAAEFFSRQRQARGPDPGAAPPDLFLSQFDELHVLRHRVHAQEREKPFVELRSLADASLGDMAIERDRFRRKRIYQA